MNTETKHAESGCTDYLQHPWESCPENKRTLPAEKPTHSPLPWSADKWATGYTISATDHSVCHLQDCNNDEANARLIVASVNGYAELQAENKRLQHHADKLAEALNEAADWLSRSARIDDQEQAADARQALAAYEAVKR